MFVKTLILLVISNNLAFQQVSSAGAEASVVTVTSRQMSPVFTDFPASTETTAEVYDHVFDLFMLVGIRFYPPKPHRSRGTEIKF